MKYSIIYFVLFVLISHSNLQGRPFRLHNLAGKVVAQEKNGKLIYFMPKKTILKELKKRERIDSIQGYSAYIDCSLGFIKGVPCLTLISKDATTVVLLHKEGKKYKFWNTACYSKIGTDCNKACYPLSECSCPFCDTCSKFSYSMR